MDFVKSGKCLLYFVEEFKSFVDRITSYNVCYTKLLRELDEADKNLILIGGPVANKLTKELQNDGKIDIDNESPATAVLIEGAANGNNVLVVAGGDRYSTESAVLSIINLI